MKLKSDFLFGGILCVGLMLLAGYWIRTVTSKSAPLPPYLELSNDGSLERTEVLVREDIKVIFLADWNCILVFKGPPDSYSIAMRGKKSLDVLSDSGTTAISEASSNIYVFEGGHFQRAQVPDGYTKNKWERFKGNRTQNPKEAKEQVLQDVLELDKTNPGVTSLGSATKCKKGTQLNSGFSVSERGNFFGVKLGIRDSVL